MPGMLQPHRTVIWGHPAGALVRIVPITGGNEEERILPITMKQYDDWQDGMNITEAFPELNAEQREWLMSGINREAWNKMFGDENA